MTPAEPEPDRTIVERVDARLGTTIAGRYRLDYKIAAGGFGAVYHAFDLVARRDVAIKVLHAALASDPAIAARFRREINTLAQLRDPHTVVAYDAGETADGSPFLVMELLAGESLHERMRGGVLPWQVAVAIARGVCCSLAEAHALGIVHRDLTPSNIHVEPRPGERDYAKVLDFGIAKLRDGIAGDEVTSVGQMVGTCDYMAPEQMIGTCVPQSDVFMLGVVLYEMIAGARPFGQAYGAAAQLAVVLGSTPAPLHGVPPELAQIVARCLDRDPDARYANGAQLADALAALMGERPAAPQPGEGPTEVSTMFAMDELERGTGAAGARAFRNGFDVPEDRRSTLPGVTPARAPSPSLLSLAPRPSLVAMPMPQQVARGSSAGSSRVARGTHDPFHQIAPQQPEPPQSQLQLQPQPQALRAPTAEPASSLRWWMVAFIVAAIAVGVAIGIGFAY